MLIKITAKPFVKIDDKVFKFEDGRIIDVEDYYAQQLIDSNSAIEMTRTTEKEVQQLEKDEQNIEESLKTSIIEDKKEVTENVDLVSLTRTELNELAKEKGISTVGKTKEAIVKELLI